MTALHDLFASDFSPWLSMMAQWFIKGVLVLAAAGLLTSLLRQRAAAVRYLVWCAALLSLLALPALTLALPAWHVPLLPTTTDVAPPDVVATLHVDRHLKSSSPTSHVAVVEPHQAPEACKENQAATLPPSVLPDTDVPSGTAVSSEAEAEAAPLLADIPVSSSDVLVASRVSSSRAAISEMLTGTSVATWLFLVWFVGVWLVLGRLVVAHIGVRWLMGRARRVEDEAWRIQAARAARRLGITRTVRLRWSPYTAVPLCIGVIQPAIVLPVEAKNLDESKREAVLLHELAHIRRHDVLTHLLAQITCALHWFNPLAWVAVRQLSIERERACDDVVLVSGTRATDYAETLLDAARSLKSGRWTTSAALAMARRSQLEGRLLSILDARPHRRTASLANSLLALALVVGIVLPLAALTPAQAQEALEPPPAPDEETGRPASPPMHRLSEPPVPTPAPYVIVVPDVDVRPIPMPDVVVDFEGFKFAFEVPDVDVDVDDFEFHLGHSDDDSVMNQALGDTLSIEQLIRLRRYGIDGDFIRGVKDLGFTDLTLRALTNLAKYGADPEYIRAIRAAGFTDLDPEELARMAKYGLDAEFAEAVHAAGYNTDGEGLIDMAKYGADAAFIAEMRATGLTDVSADDLARMAKYGVDSDLIATLNRLGYTDLDVDDFISMAKYGVDEDLIIALQELGYTALEADDVKRMLKYGVDPDFIRTMAQAGYADLSADDLVAMSKYGVDEDFVTFLAEQGYTDVTVDDLITASKYGVDEDLVGAMLEAGSGQLSIDELAELSKYGVDGDYVEELREAGLTNFTAEQLIKMRRHGIDADFVRSMQGN